MKKLWEGIRPYVVVALFTLFGFGAAYTLVSVGRVIEEKAHTCEVPVIETPGVYIIDVEQMTFGRTNHDNKWMVHYAYQGVPHTAFLPCNDSLAEFLAYLALF